MPIYISKYNRNNSYRQNVYVTSLKRILYNHFAQSWTLGQVNIILVTGSTSTHTLLQSSLDFTVPQTIDEGVQHRGEDSIVHWHNLIVVSWPVGFRSHVGKNASSKKKSHHRQVWRAGGKCLLAGFIRMHLENSSKGKTLGNQDERNGAQEH